MFSLPIVFAALVLVLLALAADPGFRSTEIPRPKHQLDELTDQFRWMVLLIFILLTGLFATHYCQSKLEKTVKYGQTSWFTQLGSTRSIHSTYVNSNKEH